MLTTMSNLVQVDAIVANSLNIHKNIWELIFNFMTCSLAEFRSPNEKRSEYKTAALSWRQSHRVVGMKNVNNKNNKNISKTMQRKETILEVETKDLKKQKLHEQ